MKKRNKKKYIILSILIIIIILILAFTLRHKSLTNNVALSTPLNNFCGDSDGKLSLDIQSKTPGVIITLNKDSECEWTKINNIYYDFCAFSMSYNDYCYDNKILRERTCSDNKIGTVEIQCPNGCLFNKCL